MEIEHNPPGSEGLYLESLNLCFPGWGDQRQFDWAFKRTVGGPPADLILLRENGALLAGSAVTYRTLVNEAGEQALVGIMTGSWTLPAARGRGAFTTIIEESVKLTTGHGGAWLLAFVTETNASFRRLEAAGSALSPTRYVSSPVGLAAPPARPVVEHDADSARGWFERFESARPPGAHFHYASVDEWAGQLVERAVRPVLVEVQGVGAALVETHGDFDRLQALCASGDEARQAVVASCLKRAVSRGKRLFLFESNPDRAEQLQQSLGLEAARGFLTSLPATSRRTSPSRWSLDSGDRM